MSPKKRNQKLLGYTRVSRMKEDGISPDLQRKAIEAYAVAHGHQVTWLEPDLDESGKSLERPSMRKALELLEQGKADGIIAARLDRLTRRVGDLGKLLELAHTQDWNLVAIDLGVDLTTANGKMVANLLGTVAEWELDRRREGWNESRTNAVSRGVFVGRSPAGYSKDEDGRLVPNDDAPKVLAAFEARARGATLAAVVRLLDGVETSRGNTQWSMTNASRLLENVVYTGTVKSGDLVQENAHEPIVGPGLFAKVQALASKPRQGDYVRRERNPLAGILRCSGCGSPLTPDHSTRNGRRYEFWRCSNRQHCSEKVTVGQQAIQEHVDKFLFHVTRQADGPSFLLRAPSTPDTAPLVSELLEAEEELRLYVETTSISAIGAELFQAGLAPRQERVNAARQQLSQAIPTQSDDFVIPAELAGEVSRTSEGLELRGEALVELWRSHFPPAAKRVIYERVFERIDVKRGRAPIEKKVDVYVGGKRIALPGSA